MKININMKELKACRCCRGKWSRKKIKSHLPGWQLVKLFIIAFINLFAQSFAITMLFPFLPFMVEFLVPGVSHTAVGRYVGVIGGALFLGRALGRAIAIVFLMTTVSVGQQFLATVGCIVGCLGSTAIACTVFDVQLGCYAWGKVADKKGRKPVIVYSNIFMGVCVFAFGFSVNVPMAVIIRLLTGLFGGTITAVKAMISDVSDDRFQAFGISVIGAAWSMGFIIGPAVSGAIADPIGQYNLTVTNPFLHGYLTRFPYSIPCLFSTLLFVVSTLLAVFCLPETLGRKRNRKRSEINQMELKLLQSNLTEKGAEEETGFDEAQEYDQEDDTTRLLEEEEDDDLSRTSNQLSTENVVISNPIVSLEEDGKESRLNGHARTGPLGTSNGHAPGVVGMDGSGEKEVEVRGVTTGLNGSELTVEGAVTSKWRSWWSTLVRSLRTFFSDLAFFMRHKNTLLPLILYMVFSFAVIGFTEILSLWAYTDPRYGGLGFSLHEIGIALTLSGVFQLPSNLFSFAILEKYFKSINVFYIGSTVIIFGIPLLPQLHYLVSVQPSITLWIMLVFVVFLLNSSTSMLFSSIFMFINNSVTFDKLGAVNGLAMTLTSLTRCVAPVLCGLIFSLTLSETTLNIGFPLDYNFVFVLFSVTYLTSVFIVACLPKSINHQKIIEDE